MGTITPINPKRNQGDAGTTTTKTEEKTKVQRLLSTPTATDANDVIIITKCKDGGWVLQTTFNKPEDVLFGLRISESILMANISL